MSILIQEQRAKSTWAASSYGCVFADDSLAVCKWMLLLTLRHVSRLRLMIMAIERPRNNSSYIFCIDSSFVLCNSWRLRSFISSCILCGLLYVDIAVLREHSVYGLNLNSHVPTLHLRSTSPKVFCSGFCNGACHVMMCPESHMRWYHAPPTGFPLELLGDNRHTRLN